MAKGDSPVLETLVEINAVSLVAPIVGAPRAASAGVKMADALDLAISFAIDQEGRHARRPLPLAHFPDKGRGPEAAQGQFHQRGIGERPPLAVGF